RRGSMTGKVGYIPRAREIEFYEYGLPDVEPGAILAQVTRTNVCGSEVHMWRGEFGKRGIMPGHEMVGHIYRLGKGVTTDPAGQRPRPCCLLGELCPLRGLLRARPGEPALRRDPAGARRGRLGPARHGRGEGARRTGDCPRWGGSAAQTSHSLWRR